MSYMFGIACVTDQLYLCSASPVNRANLAKHKITCVIDARECSDPTLASVVEYINLPIADSEHTDIASHFDSISDKIAEHERAGGRTLVHCLMGKSRSATLCLAYLMKYKQQTLRQAYETVYAARPIICPNLGFWRQLMLYDEKLNGGICSVQMVHNTNCWPPRVPDVVVECRQKRMAQTKAEIEAAKQ